MNTQYKTNEQIQAPQSELRQTQAQLLKIESGCNVGNAQQLIEALRKNRELAYSHHAEMRSQYFAGSGCNTKYNTKQNTN